MGDARQILTGTIIIIGAVLFLIIGLSSIGNSTEITMQNSGGIFGGFGIILVVGIFLILR